MPTAPTKRLRRTAATGLAGAIGFALGTLPSADLAARASGGDVRGDGTGNPGGLNAHHVLGPRWGAAVTIADIGKGTAAAKAGAVIAGPVGANVAATAAVVGHCFPPGRTGGKGVATSIGQVVGTFPTYLPLDAAVAFATSALPFFRQRTRVATSVASIVWIGCSAASWRTGYRNPGGVRPTASLPLAALASSAVIAVRFRAEAERVDAFNATVEEVAA